jgi:hypothetical protein
MNPGWVLPGANPIPRTATFRGIRVEFKPATPDSFATAALVANRPEHPGLQRLMGVTTDTHDQSWIVWETLSSDPSVWPAVVADPVAVRSVILQVIDLIVHLNRHRLVHRGLCQASLSLIVNEFQEEKNDVVTPLLVSLGDMWQVQEVDASVGNAKVFTLSTQVCSECQQLTS